MNIGKRRRSKSKLSVSAPVGVDWKIKKKNRDNIIYWKIVKKRIFTRYGKLNYFEKSEEIRKKKMKWCTHVVDRKRERKLILH